MGRYLMQASYTPRRGRRWSSNRRTAACRSAAWWNGPAGASRASTSPSATHDVVTIVDLPDHVAAAAVSIAASAGGGIRSIQTTPLLTSEDALGALGRARAVEYEPPGDGARSTRPSGRLRAARSPGDHREAMPLRRRRRHEHRDRRRRPTLAEHVGRRLAELDAVVVCGGLGGVMEAIARGAARRRRDRRRPAARHRPDRGQRHLTVALTTGLGEMRNPLVVRSAPTPSSRSAAPTGRCRRSRSPSARACPSSGSGRGTSTTSWTRQVPTRPSISPWRSRRGRGRPRPLSPRLSDFRRLRVDSAGQQAELVALGVREHHPRLLPLADVDAAGHRARAGVRAPRPGHSPTG